MSGRHVLTMNLKGDPGVVESYTRHHRDVWPEVQASLRQRRCGADGHLSPRPSPRDGRRDARWPRLSHRVCSARVVESTSRGMGTPHEVAPGTCRRGACRRMVGRHGAGLSSESGYSGGAGHCPRRRSVAHVLSPGAITHLRQAWAVPSRPRPIVIIGAGGVVRTAHLPVYQRLKFPVAGLYDINPDASRETARRFGVSTVFSSLAEAAASADAVFDVAVPGDQIAGVLKDLPRGAAVLIQKPMGEDLAAARSIVGICRELGLVAAMNFQLRFSPNVLALRDLLAARRARARSSTSKCGWL